MRKNHPESIIAIFIREVNIQDLIVRWFANEKILGFSMNKTIKEITDNILKITQYWYDNNNLRFSQVLVIMGYIPLMPGDWYLETDLDILRIHNINVIKEIAKIRAQIYMSLKDAHLDKPSKTTQ